MIGQYLPQTNEKPQFQLIFSPLRIQEDRLRLSRLLANNCLPAWDLMAHESVARLAWALSLARPLSTWTMISSENSHHWIHARAVMIRLRCSASANRAGDDHCSSLLSCTGHGLDLAAYHRSSKFVGPAHCVHISNAWLDLNSDSLNPSPCASGQPSGYGPAGERLQLYHITNWQLLCLLG
jgi:hypothetical protein